MPVTVSEKGWVVIPADLRKRYNLHPGAEVTVVDYGGVLALVPAMTKPVRQPAGMLKGRTSLTRGLLREHRRERSRGVRPTRLSHPESCRRRVMRSTRLPRRSRFGLVPRR